jgi:WD40 repeat protein
VSDPMNPAVTYRQQQIRIIDLPRGKILHTLDRKNEERIASVTYSPAGKQIAFTTEKTVTITDPDGKNERTINRESGSFLPLLELSPDGKRLLVLNHQIQAELWNPGRAMDPQPLASDPVPGHRFHGNPCGFP